MVSKSGALSQPVALYHRNLKMLSVVGHTILLDYMKIQSNNTVTVTCVKPLLCLQRITIK